MKRTLILAAVVGLLTTISVFYFVFYQPNRAVQKVSAENETTEKMMIGENLVVAPGIVEAISEEIEVGAEIPGKLKQVLVEEGEQVLKGQTLAVLENADFAAQIVSAKSQIETLRRQKKTAEARILQAKTERVRIFNGSR